MRNIIRKFYEEVENEDLKEHMLFLLDNCKDFNQFNHYKKKMFKLLDDKEALKKFMLKKPRFEMDAKLKKHMYEEFILGL